MEKILILQYLEWYFIERTLKILKAWKGLIFSYFNYFSVLILIKTFFSPWRGISEGYGRGLDIQRYTEAFALNTMSRIIGVIYRTFFLIIAVFAETIIIVGGIVIFILWLLFPVLAVLAIYYGISIIL